MLKSRAGWRGTIIINYTNAPFEVCEGRLDLRFCSLVAKMKSDLVESLKSEILDAMKF